MRLTTTPRAIAAGIAGVCAIGSAASAQLTEWTLGGANLQYASRIGDGVAYNWVNYPTAASVEATPFFDGLRIFGGGVGGNVFTLTGDGYIPTPAPVDPEFRGNRLVIFGTATFDGAAWAHPAGVVRTLFDFGLTFSGGPVNFYAADTSFTLLDAQGQSLIGVGSGTPGGLGLFQPGQHDFNFFYEDRFASNFQTATHMEWAIILNFDWATSGAQLDTLSLVIPPTSIDIQVVPTPGALALMALAALAASRRRRE